MKQKYLLSMLLGGALLTACSVEDDFNVAPVAQETNSSAPTFTVGFDGADLLTRSDYKGIGKGNKITFDSSDKLSLFHGVSTTLKEENDNATLETFTGYGNAIYQGKEVNDADGNLIQYKFTTQAMIREGGAILIWPADTIWNNMGGAAPVIEIRQDQDKTDKFLTPYMSDFITLVTKDDMTENPGSQTAGYGRDYRVSLKRAASTLYLHLVETNNTAFAGITNLTTAFGAVPALAFEQVTLADKSGSTPFTTKIYVKSTGETPYKAANGTDAQKAEYSHWSNVSTFDQITLPADAQKASISTKDVEDGLAVFTLLPAKTSTSIADATGADGADGQIVVSTNYGTITLTDAKGGEDALADGDKIWSKKADFSASGADATTVTKGLNALLENNGIIATGTEKNSPMFVDEPMGAAGERWLKVNMGKLKMTGLHIKNEKHLLETLKVYEYLSANVSDFDTDVTLILDGEASGDNEGRFVMTEDAWKAVVAKNGTGIKFKPCSGKEDGGVDEEVCKAVKLVNSKGAVIEVPVLQFAEETVVELEGQWQYTEAEKEIKEVTILRVINSNPVSKLTLAGTVGAKESPEDVTIDVEKGGEVEVTGEVILNFNMNNHGKITIPAGMQLRVGKNVTLTNCEAPQKKVGNNWGYNGWDQNDEELAGYIENSGTLAIVEQNNLGTINNYGVIRAMTKEARTLVTNNEYSKENTTEKFEADFAKAFSNVNKIGSIYLFNKDDGNENTTVRNETNKGFIKLELDANSAEIKEGTVNDKVVGTVANYIIVGGDLTKVTNAVQSNKKVKYIEIQSTEEVVFSGDFIYDATNNKNAYDFTGIIVPAEKRAFIPSSTKVRTVTLYLQGNITKAGDLQYKKETVTSYYGESDFTKINVN